MNPVSHITLINKLFITIANILKSESNDKTEKHRFYSFGTAEPHPILYNIYGINNNIVLNPYTKNITQC